MVEIRAIRFKQWLEDWDSFEFSDENFRRKPSKDIFIFSMPAVQLRALSGVYRRKREQGSADAQGLQRLHDPKRSATIRDFVRFGHPYSSIPEAARSSASKLKKPGWLPTAIVVNILRPDDVRRGRKVDPADIVTIRSESDNCATINIPYDDALSQWSPKTLEPFEVIDGQHRLWAFDEALEDGTLPGDFELPVVAFDGLDIGWQAYLFWSINISPKRINPSHAFDLFPLLRSEEWLQTFSEIRIYREARAQEITDILFTHRKSPWHQRINMLGEAMRDAPAGAGVTQAGWVRGILSTFLAAGGRGRATKGLFASEIGDTGPLQWSRAQQAAAIITLWRDLQDAVCDGTQEWVQKLLNPSGQQALIPPDYAPAFSGNQTMLNQEQGVRGVLTTANDLLFGAAESDIRPFVWETDILPGIATTDEDIDYALTHFENQPIRSLVREVAQSLASFDWRSANAEGLDEQTRLIRRAFRGSGGYTELRTVLLNHLLEHGSPRIKDIASKITTQRER